MNANETTKSEVAKLAENASLKDVIHFVNALALTIPPKRDRGPDSEGSMTDADAAKAKELFAKGMKVKDIVAAMPGRSYGQVYSAVKGFTFKKVKAS